MTTSKSKFSMKIKRSKVMVKDFLKWMVREEEKAWQSCRKGKFYSVTRKQAGNLPSPLKKEYEKKGYLGPMMASFLREKRHSRLDSARTGESCHYDGEGLQVGEVSSR